MEIYLDSDTLRAQGPHLAPRHSQTPLIRHTDKQISTLSIDDGILAARIDGHRGIAGGIFELGPKMCWKELLETLEGPMNSHGPFIAPDVELGFPFEDGVWNSCLSYHVRERA